MAPAGRDVRPTSDRVREALFDILRDRVTGSRFLDLFAGSGAVGIEALSRGAALVVLVESDRSALRALEKNLSSLGIAASVAATRHRAARGEGMDVEPAGTRDPNPAATGDLKPAGSGVLELAGARNPDPSMLRGSWRPDEAADLKVRVPRPLEPGETRVRAPGGPGDLEPSGTRELETTGTPDLETTDHGDEPAGSGVLHVVRTPWPGALATAANLGGPFSIAFADPPYKNAPIVAILESLSAPGLLLPAAMVVIEHEIRSGVPGQAGTLNLQRIARYGRAGLAFYGPGT